MGNATTKNYSRSVSVGTSSRKTRWDGPGFPAPPGKPILISGTNDAQPDVVAIRWDRSPSNGGSAIVGYLVEHRRLGSPHWLRSSSGLCAFPELTLSGLEPGWRYQFRVRAQNALGLSQPSEVSEPLTVTLQRTAAAACAPRFDLELKDTIALENEQAEFVVQFSGIPLPKISWFKDGFEIFSSRRTRIITDDSKSVLLIHQTALNDEGEIKCTATNRAGHISTRAKLILEAPPRIRLPRQYEDGLLFEQDETIRLKVSLAGRPAPTVTWYHDGELVSKDARHVFEEMDGESVLKIPDAKRNDRGEYSIKVKNKLGEDATSFLVTVTDRPAAPGKVAVTMTLGRSVTLSWKEPQDDGGCKIGTYIVEYYRIGWEVWLKATTSRRTTATLTELIEGSEYKFRVKAENPYGVSDPSEESDVIFIPDLKRRNVTPSLSEKSQSHREISRSRGDKLEVSFTTPAQRTRSLTREEGKTGDNVGGGRLGYDERSASAQRLVTSAADRPSRVDSRVTFALDTLEKDQPPIPPARSRDHSSMKQEVPLGDHIDRSNIAAEARDKPEIKRERTMSPKPVATVVISPPVVEEDLKSRTVITEFVTRDRRSLSPLSVPRTQEYQREESRAANSILKRQTAVMNEPTVWTPPRSPQTLPREDEESALHDSSEFMLVLYPEDGTQERDVTNDAETRTGRDDKRNMFGLTEDENDLLPPPMSLSLPELFSIQHQVVEAMREAVSSSELLHERAMERFYRAIAAEEASEVAKRRMQLERQTGELAQSDIDNVQRSSFRRRLSNSGVTTQNLIVSWQAKKNRRRSSEGQTDREMKFLSPTLLPDVEARSDPNLPSEMTMADFWRRSNDEESVERLRRWHETINAPLLEEARREKSIRDEKVAISATVNGTETQATGIQTKSKEEERKERLEESIETSEESSEEISSADSEDLRLLKSRILARQVIDEEDTYHPRGRPIAHVELEVPQISYDKVPTLEIPSPPSIRVVDSPTPVSPSNLVPKSILKKPKEVSTQRNSYGRAVPPEKPIRKTLSQYQKDNTERMDIDAGERLSDHPSTPESLKTPAMSESDTDSILSAAEAAKNRRIQSKLRSMTSEEETAELEARMAVVNQYTEIVREYSNHSRGHDSAASSRRSSISEDQEQKYRVQEKLATKKQQIDTSESKIKDKSEVEKQKQNNQAPGRRRGNVDSRGTTPARETTIAKERHGSKPSSRDQSPAVRRRDLSKERAGGASSRSSSRTRNRTPSRDRSNRSLLRNDPNESGVVREKSIERGTRRSKVPSRPSSRSSSRSNSRERYGASVPVESKVEKLQRALGSNKYRATRRGSENSKNVEEGTVDDRSASGEQLVLEAKKTVRSTVRYITDLTLLIAAMYVYFFKRETLAVPFIVLLLYRRVQEEIHGWMPRRWWRRSSKKR